MGKSGKRKKTFSLPDIFRSCKGKGNADDDRHAYQKQSLHTHQARRSDRNRRDNASIEEHHELKEYRIPNATYLKRDDENKTSNSRNITHGVTRNKTENDTTEVTKVHVEPLNRNGAIKAYMLDTPDARVDSPKEVPDDKEDCANSFEDIPFIDADDEKGDAFQTILIAEMGIKEKNEDQVHSVLVNEIQGCSVIETVSTIIDVRNQKTLNSDNELVAFMDTKANIEDLNTNRKTVEILSIEQAESALNIQDAIGDISEPDVSYTTIVVKDEIQVEEKIQETTNRGVEIVESTSDVVLPSVPTIFEDDVDDEIIKKADDLAIEGDQFLNKVSYLETSSQTDNENTDDLHVPDSHDIDTNSHLTTYTLNEGNTVETSSQTDNGNTDDELVPDSHDIDSKPHLTTYALNEGSNVETFSESDNDNVDNVTNVHVLESNDVVSKLDHATVADSNNESGNEQEEGTNTNNNEIQVNKNTKQIYHNSFDDDDDTQHTFKNDDDDDRDFDTPWYDTRGATDRNSLSKVFKADQNKFRPNLEVEAWNNKFDLSEPTYSVASNDIRVKTPLKEDLPEKALPDKSDNVLFYQNKIKSRPPIGHTIEDMLKWMGDYAFLEKNHSYIQWLFPIPGSSGMNYQAQALQDHEVEIMKNDEAIQGRVIRSFRMMLDFYGMEMVDDTFQRNERNWQARYNHLNQSFHNRMRITRIIQSLGELGLTKIQTRWLSFLMQEAMVNKSLNRLGGDSMQYFIDAIKEDDDRHKLYEKYFRYMMGDFTEPKDNDDDGDGNNVEDKNGENVEDTSDGNSEEKSDKNVDGKSNENVDAKDGKNDEGKSDENGNDDVSNGCDSGETDEVNTNVMQDMSADNEKIEKGSTGSIALSDSVDNDISDTYSTAEEDTDHVDQNISEREDHVYEGVNTDTYVQNIGNLATVVTCDTNGDTSVTDNGNGQTCKDNGESGKTMDDDRAQEEDKSDIDDEKFETQSSGSDNSVTDKAVNTYDDFKNKKLTDVIDKVVDTAEADLNIDSGSDNNYDYFVFHSTDGTIAH